MSKKYSYDELNDAGRAARSRLFSEGVILKKTGRKKPRDPETLRLLYDRAMNRLRRFPPRKEDDRIVLPYFE